MFPDYWPTAEFVTISSPLPCVLQFIVDHAERTSDKGLVSELPARIDQTPVQAR